MPTKAKANQVDATDVRFYVAEDFREEVSNKVSAVGLYPDCHIHLNMPSGAPDPTPQKAAALHSLCFLFNIFGAPVTATVSINIEGPVTAAVVVPSRPLPPSGTANLIVRMEPCIVPALGKRTFIVKVDEREFRFDYFLDRLEIPGQVAIDNPRPSKAAPKATPKKTETKKKTAT